MLKKQSHWIQPPTVKGISKTPTINFETMLSQLKNMTDSRVNNWGDINRIDVRPGKGVAKVQLENSIEVQLDLSTGQILQVAKRRSDLIEDIHTGVYFGNLVKYGIFFTTALILFIQLITGSYLFIRPLFLKRKRYKKAIGNRIVNTPI